MKSKSFNLKQKTPDGKLNKTFDFTGYYKSADETNKALENSIVIGNAIVGNKLESNSKDSKRERSPKKKRNKLEPLDVSRIDIEGPSLDSSVARGTPLNESKVTSTPQGSHKNQVSKVKSIMKNSLVQGEDNMDDSHYVASPGKPKKRNKSVSFMLEESEQVAIKKTKSNDCIDNKPSSPKKADSPKPKKFKKLKRDLSEKENKDNGNVNMETGETSKVSQDVKKLSKNTNEKEENSSKDMTNDEQKEAPASSNLQKAKLNKKRKLKKFKKQNSEETMESCTGNNNNEEQVEHKHKKLKKKKQSAKPTQTIETDADGEPTSKSRKTDSKKPDAIVENLENLSIGDNAHTLTNLLDDMNVAEKDKRKKNKRKIKKDKKQTGSTTSSENAELEKDEEKEKVKWKKRKWNKDKKGEVDEDSLPTSVIIENLPLSMMCVYKKVLSDHFGKHGIIKKIGIAEVYPTEESKPVFTTTINFYSDGAASNALEENNTMLEGRRIRVRAPLPPTRTTLVVRSYAELSDQTLSTTFLPAGKIRNIRHLVKGKKVIATAFVEFDGPEALEKALKLGQESKINGKKMHVSKFEIRKKKKKKTSNADSENEGDSENSND